MAFIDELFFSFVMNGMLPQSWAILAQFEFFSARFPSDGIVVISGLFADEEDCFRFLFTFFSFTFACHVRSPNDVSPYCNTSDTVGKVARRELHKRELGRRQV